jgi:hypothetical protein
MDSPPRVMSALNRLRFRFPPCQTDPCTGYPERPAKASFGQPGNITSGSLARTGQPLVR